MSVKCEKCQDQGYTSEPITHPKDPNLDSWTRIPCDCMAKRVKLLETAVGELIDVEGAGDVVLVSRDLLESIVSDEDCWLDHHGGCQTHGYLGLEPDETCPQRELWNLLYPDKAQ